MNENTAVIEPTILQKSLIINPCSEIKTKSNLDGELLPSILPYYVALSHGVAPASPGLNKKDENRAFLQCLDPCAYTGGGTVIFELEIMK